MNWLINAYQQLLASLTISRDTLESTETSVNAVMPTTSMLEKLALGFRDYEGAPGDLNYQLNNPGDCRPSPDGYLAKYEPVEIIDTDTDPTYPYHRGKFAKFPTYDIGWLYLNNLLENMIENHPNWTLLQLVQAYAPSSDGNEPVAYSNFLGRRLGVDASTYQIKNILV